MPASSLSVEQELLEWASKRPGWQREVLGKLARGETYGPDAIQDLADRLVAENDAGRNPLIEADLPRSQPGAPSVALQSLGELRNVNALSGSQPLEFASQGLTVIYGDNASGKSGYARLVKSVVSAIHTEAVLPNVFSADNDPQAARFSYQLDASRETATWPDEIDSQLRAIRFYDEACGDAYLSKESEVTYRPSVLTIVDGLVEVCEQVKVVLDQRLQANHNDQKALPNVPGGTSADQFLKSLSATTTAAAIDAASEIPDDANAKLASLAAEEARLAGSNPASERARLQKLTQGIQRLVDLVESSESVVRAGAQKEAEQLYSKSVELRAAAEQASKIEFDDEPVPGVGADTWRAMWQAAKEFSEAEAFHGQHFPATAPDDRCVLCQQELSDSAKHRLRKFQKFVEDRTEQLAQSAEKGVVDRLKAISDFDPLPVDVASKLSDLKGHDPKLEEATRLWLEYAAKAKTSLSDILNGKEATTQTAPATPLAELKKAAADLTAKSSAIDDTKFTEEHAKARADKSDLDGRIAISQGREIIEHEITRRKARAALEAAKRLVDTTAISNQAKAMTEDFASTAVNERFAAESANLKLGRVELQPTGARKGKLFHRPGLDGATQGISVSDVLSEGEQTALGLAGFFTEATLDQSKSPLVFDDPVTSLDHIRRRKVANRIVELGSDRQAVVFTHDSSFVRDLQVAAKEQSVPLSEVRVERDGSDAPGTVREGHPWSVKTVGARFNEIERRIARLKREKQNWDKDTYEAEAAQCAGYMSETWERIIEEEVAGVIVDRGSREIRVKRFRFLALINDEDNKVLQESYSRCSEWAPRHDKSREKNYIAPDPQDLEGELKVMREWFDRVKGYANKS